MCNGQDYPRLPPELEHRIFAESYRDSLRQEEIPKGLLLVAKRVHECVVQVIPQWPPKITDKLLEKYGHHVRHYHTTISSIKSVYRLCPNITDLAFWKFVFEKDFEMIMTLPITRLSINASDFFHPTNPDIKAVLPSFCAKITHLDVSSRSVWASEELLSQLLALTHVTMFDDAEEKDIRACLNHGKALKVILLVSNLPDLPEPLVEWEPEGCKVVDPKIVYLKVGRKYSRDWKIGAYGGMDMWAFADEVMEERWRPKKAKEITV